MSSGESEPPKSPGPDQDPSIAEAVQEISERAVLLVQEEIALAKAEISEKFHKLLVGTVVTAVAAVFIFWALAIILFGFAYLVVDITDLDYYQQYWGFFIVGGLLLVLAALGGFIAFRFFKAGSPPVPTMAIDEAQRIRESVMPSGDSPSPAGGSWASDAAAAPSSPSSGKLPYEPPVYKSAQMDPEPEVDEDPDEQDKA